MTTTQKQRTKVSSAEALPSDGLYRLIRAGAWAAIASGVVLVASFLYKHIYKRRRTGS
jgi:hypothetical protein